MGHSAEFAEPGGNVSFFIFLRLSVFSVDVSAGLQSYGKATPFQNLLGQDQRDRSSRGTAVCLLLSFNDPFFAIISSMLSRFVAGSCQSCLMTLWSTVPCSGPLR